MKRPKATWPARLQVILALFLMLSASPLATSAQVATPVSDPETPVVSTTPSPASEPAPADPAVPAEKPSGRTSSQPNTAAPFAEGDASIQLSLMQCENDDLAGTIDFFPIQGVIAASSNTSTNCQAVPADASVEMYLINEDTGDFILIEQAQLEVPAGTYSFEAYINDSQGISGPIGFAPDSATLVQIISYVPATVPGEIVEGFGSVQVFALECINQDRAGETDFFVISTMMQRSASSECLPVEASGLSLTLVNTEDPSQVLNPDASDDFSIVFSDVPSGTWSITDVTSGAQSAPIVISDGQSASVQMVSYVSGPVDLFIEKIFCEDSTRAGTTDFTLDTPPSMFSAMATGSTCVSVPPPGEIQSITVTLDNQDTGDSYRVNLAGGAWYLEDIAPGTYIATESIDGSSVSSDALVIVEPGKRLRIINYVAAQTEQPEPGDGFGILSGTILYCTSPDRSEGEVDFIVRQESWLRAASTSECAFGGGTSGGLLTLYPAEPGTGTIDETGATQIWTDGMSYSTDLIQSGSYVLGYTSPFTGETTLSAIFTIAHRADTIVDLNVFSQPAFTTYLDIAKDICVDPARAGDTSFQLITEQGGFQVAAAEEGSATDCRYAVPSDGEITYTLTNLDTGEVWTRMVLGGEYISFDNLLAGTYTLAETHNGVTATSHDFVLEPSIDIWHWMRIRNFVAEKDWAEPDPDGNQGWIGIFAYSCANPARDGGTEWFRNPVILANQMSGAATSRDATVPATSDTSDCVTMGEADGIGFIATPVNGVGGPYEFFENGPGLFELTNFDGLPAGDYIITEVSTGATSGVVRVVYWTGFSFLMFEELPKAEVTLDIESADPAVADTLPADATWTITSVTDPSFTLSGTFAPDNLQMPTSITLDSPLPYGDYQLDISAGPAFEAYSNIFTVGPMELASTQLMGLMQLPPDQVTWDIVLQPVQQPAPSPSPSATATATPVAGETPTATVMPDETPTNDPTATSAPASPVTQLPSTGGGNLGGPGGILMIFATLAAVIAGAGALIVRSPHRRG